MTASNTLLAGRYLLLDPLGRGGMARVWRGVDTKLNRPVAVKEIIPVEGLTPEELVELRPRALREARAAARLNHPNVVRVYDIVAADGVPWIVMQHVPSRSLLQIVTEDGPLPPSLAARYGLDVLAALTAAHRVGVLHRDVKPSNVLITEAGRAVLTDFGLATISGDPAVTRTGVVIGTPSFMAPERAADTVVGPAADLWSLGASLYFAVQGRAPYERSSTLATLSALANEEPPFAPASGPLWPVLAGLLRREPDTRLSASAVRATLRRVAVPGSGALRWPPVVRSPATAPPFAPAPSPPDTQVTATVPVSVARPSGRAVALIGAALILVVGLLIWLVPRTVPDHESVGPASPTTASAGAPTPPTTTPATPATPDETGPVLPEGWHTYVDRTGFSVAVPESWTVSRRGSIVYFDEPGAGRLLGIDQTDHPEPDPVADWTAKESYRVARGDFPGYHRIRLVAVDYFVKAADWEFTYLRDGVRMHVNNRGFITSPHRAYGMWWSTPDADWNRFRPDLQLIQRSFHPARG